MAQFLGTNGSSSYNTVSQTRQKSTPGPLHNLNYKVLGERLKEFLGSFADDDFDGGAPKLKYMTQLEDIFHRRRKVLEVDVEDVYKWGMDTGNMPSEKAGGLRHMLHNEIISNARRFTDLFSTAADEIIDQMRSTIPAEQIDKNDRILALALTRRAREEEYRNAQAAAENIPGGATNAENANKPAGPGADPANLIPAIMTRTFETRIVPRPADKMVPLRDVRSDHVGHLVTVSGIVTRVTEVKPRVAAAAYLCRSCGFEVYQEITGRSYMPLQTCPTPACGRKGAPPGELIPNYRDTKYVKYQELKLQEPADQVPIGNIPRTINVKLNGEMTRTCTAGDVVSISGIFLPMPYTGYRALKAGFLADTFLEATKVVQLRKNYSDEYLTKDMKDELHRIRNEPELYSRLARSIAPEIFGQEDVKKALLLLLLSAPPKALPDGMKLRGDIHICLMGDPGVAKSQLLKHITKVAPRSVYTTGKGSSGVGLTAAVMRDAVTKELMLEGGALVLADKGICCIDEFDKMNETDRTAIHEVMEQQTVSIAKAGITTRLNARTSVLAAANPAYGRYNRSRSPAENINLPAALLSRFDLLFLLLDTPKADQDLALARHVTHVHRTGAHPELGFEVVDPKVIRAHISEARRVDPIVPKDSALTEYLVNNYVAMRASEVDAGREAKGYTSARVLLGILRLAQALARLRLATVVDRADVDEALRLMKASKASLEDDEPRRRRFVDDDEDDLDAHFGSSMRAADPAGNSEKNRIWAIYGLISAYMEKEVRTSIPIAVAEELCDDSGYTRDELMKTIDEYEELNLWSYDTAENTIMIV